MNRRQVPAAVTVILLAAAIAFCAFGAVRGEPDIVLKKAVNICMECIGLV